MALVKKRAGAPSFHKSKAWRQKREAILFRDKGMCHLSKRFGKTVAATTVHHIYPVEHYPQFALCDWNLISLSAEQHNRLHDRTTHELTKEGLRLQERTQILK